jgi:hypothetical protein
MKVVHVKCLCLTKVNRNNVFGQNYYFKYYYFRLCLHYMILFGLYRSIIKNNNNVGRSKKPNKKQIIDIFSVSCDLKLTFLTRGIR